MIFPSKKDIWMGVLIWALIGIFIWILYEAIFIDLNILTIIAMVCMILFCLSIWFHTKYEIAQNNLIISFGPIKKSIPIQDIEFVHFTKHPFTAPALSLHRIEINYSKYKTITISPKDRKAFLEELRKKNDHIKTVN